MTSKENLDQIIMEMKKEGAPEIRHIILKSTAGQKRKSMI